ncbi:urease isoform X2 [Tanacetum coccineum]
MATFYYRDGLPVHPVGKWFQAEDLTSILDATRVVTMAYYFGKTNFRTFLKQLINEVERNRYRGFIKIDVYFDEVYCLSWVYRKLQFYLVGVVVNGKLYELGDTETGPDNRWLRKAMIIGYKETYGSLFSSKGLSGVEVSYAKMIESVYLVTQNPNDVEKWRPSFGLFTVVFSEGSRFIPIGDMFSKVMVPGGGVIKLGGHKESWPTFFIINWGDICKRARKGVHEIPFTMPTMTLEVARMCRKNAAFAKAVLGLLTYHQEEEKDRIIELAT